MDLAIISAQPAVAPESNVMENLSHGVVDLGSLLLDLADDAGDGRSCFRDERGSGASRREGSLSATVHVRVRMHMKIPI